MIHEQAEYQRHKAQSQIGVLASGVRITITSTISIIISTMPNLSSEVLEEVVSLLEQGGELTHRLAQGLVRHALPEHGLLKRKSKD